MIPNGLHFVYHSTGMGARQGFFITASKNDIIVTSWDPGNEEIVITPLLNEAQLENLRNGVRRGDLNSNLGPYPLAQHGNWVNLTNMITEAVLERADVSVGTLVYPGDVEDDAHLSAALNAAAVKPYFPGLARIARFVPLKELEVEFTKNISVSRDMTAEEVSRVQMDRSSFLEMVVSAHYGESLEALLGELQLSFVLFMLIYSYPALEHWKKLVYILCQCEEMMRMKPTFYAKFLRILYEQLGYSPEDFFHTELSHENFLRPAMTSLFQILNAEGLPSTLEEHRRRLLMFMRKKFNLFDENAGEDYFKYDDVPLHRYKNLSSVAPSADEMYNLVDEDRPVVVFLNADESDAAESQRPDGPKVVMRDVETKDVEKEKFGWRYPSLFESMDRGEDMTMAAVRLIELSHNDEAVDNDADKVNPIALLEARIFIENEVPLFSGSAI